jgi:prepilin-type N-terminal cleavage/methylation domain-containing protein/prepilin-type processing-associated H-X9-DG protein
MNSILNDTFNSQVSNRGPGRENSNGFTFTELLVVLAVVAILTLTLLPALARTKLTGKNLQCLSNLQTWARALQIYASENNEQMPRDGMGQNGLYTGNIFNGVQTGHPTDNWAWFNQLPQLFTERRLMDYYNDPGANPSLKLPFPGGKGMIWHCPNASMTPTEVAMIFGGGVNGFFSYAVNIDLKRDSSGSVVAYPVMPKLTTIPKPTATVFMFDGAFNPVSDVVNNSPQFNSVNPAIRYRSFTTRHNLGGNIAFLDGHATYFKSSYVFGPSPSPGEPTSPDIYWWPHRNP